MPLGGVTAGCPQRMGLSSLPACAADPVFGYELYDRLIRVLARRLQGTRTRLIARSLAAGADGR